MKLSRAVVAFVLSTAASVCHAGSADRSTSKVVQAALHQVEQQQQQPQQLEQLTKPSKYGHGVKPGPRELHSVRAAAADAYKKVPKLRLKARENRKAFENMLRGLAVSKEEETLAVLKGAVKHQAPMPIAKRRNLMSAQSQSMQQKQPVAMQGQPPKETMAKEEVVVAEQEEHISQPERKLDENYNQAYKQYNQQYGNYYNGNANAYQYNGNANANAYNYNNAGGNGNYQQQQYNGNQQNANGGAEGGYYSYGGEYDWDQAMAEQDFGFDITDYAIKYTGCHRIETFNDNVAQNENINSVLGIQSFATFRLCPADECYENNVWGCSSNYGEYVVAMEDFLGGLLGYNEERVYGYCEYCAECANIESYKDWAAQVKMQKAYTVEHAESLFETYYQNLIAKEQEEAQYVQSQSYSSSSNTKSNWWNWGNNNKNSNNYKSQSYNQNQAQDQNANGQTYMQDMDEDEAKAYAMVKYYNKVKNNQYQYGANAAYGYGNGNSGNNKNSNSNYKGGYYANGQYNPNNGYYGGNNNAYMQQSMASQYDAYNQNMWQFSSGNQNYNNLYTQDSNYQNKQKYQSWQSMGQFATFGPYMVYPGYFDDDGAFVSGYGYFNAYGTFVSLEDNGENNNNKDGENSGAIDYDYEIYGDMPEGWADLIGTDPDEVESCQMNYAGNCYTQYSTCMYLLYDEAQTTQQEYNEFIANQISTYTAQGINYEEMWEEMEVNWEAYQENAASSQTVQKSSQQTHDRQKEIEQLMMCQQVNYNPYKWPGYEGSGNYNNAQTQQIYEQENSYSNQQVNAEMYQYNMYIESQIEACEGDADCEEALEYQREQNTEYQTWVKENQNHQWKDYQDANLGYYIGASCDASSGSLGLAVYRDEDCTVADETYTVERILGYDPMDFIDDLVPHECIACGLDVSN
jgi:hypothetical protein